MLDHNNDDICKKYDIWLNAKLQVWIKVYNGHETLNASGTGEYIIMVKRRKTTSDERIDEMETSYLKKSKK